MNDFILVVDDHPASVKQIETAFGQSGVEYGVESDVDAAGDLLFAVPSISLVVIRSHSENIDGLELCRRIRSTRPFGSLHVLMIVSDAVPDQTTLALNAGADDIIVEPFSRSELLTRCRYQCRRHTRRIEARPEDAPTFAEVIRIENPADEPTLPSVEVDDTEFLELELTDTVADENCGTEIVEDIDWPMESEPVDKETQPTGSTPRFQIHQAEDHGFINETTAGPLDSAPEPESQATPQRPVVMESFDEATVQESPDSVMSEPIASAPVTPVPGPIQTASQYFHQPEQSNILQPSFDPNSQRYVYPAESAEQIDAWNNDPNVIKVPLDTVLTCPECAAVPNFRFGCGACGSGSIEQEMLIHHFACACVASEREFRADRTFICPKCRVGGLVAGTDFETMSGCFACADCFASVDQPELIGHCMQCSLRFPAHEATVVQLVAYQLPVRPPVQQRPRFTAVRQSTTGRTLHRT